MTARSYTERIGFSFECSCCNFISITEESDSHYKMGHSSNDKTIDKCNVVALVVAGV